MFLLIILFFVIAAVAALFGFRYITRLFGAQKLVAEGIELTDAGIEIPHYLWLGKRLVSYRDVQSVELLPWYKVVLGYPLLRYGIAVSSFPTRLVRDALAITLKGPDVSETVLVTPKDAAQVAEELKRRVQESKSSPSDNR
jgi:hypothetical protein